MRMDIDGLAVAIRLNAGLGLVQGQQSFEFCDCTANARGLFHVVVLVVDLAQLVEPHLNVLTHALPRGVFEIVLGEHGFQGFQAIKNPPGAGCVVR